MSGELDVEILKLLKSEGYKINEIIRDAVNDLIETVQEENDGMEEEEDEEEEER